jgi:hypothetical protein
LRGRAAVQLENDVGGSAVGSAAGPTNGRPSAATRSWAAPSACGGDRCKGDSSADLMPEMSYGARIRGAMPRKLRSIRTRAATAKTVQISKPHARTQNEILRFERRSRTSANPSNGRAQRMIVKRYEIPDSGNSVPTAPPTKTSAAVQVSLRKRDRPDLRNNRRPAIHKLAHATRTAAQRIDCRDTANAGLSCSCCVRPTDLAFSGAAGSECRSRCSC